MPNEQRTRTGAIVTLPDTIRFDGAYDPMNTMDLYAHYIRLGMSERQNLMRVLAEMFPDTFDSLLSLIQSPGSESQRQEHYNELAGVGLGETQGSTRMDFSSNSNDVSGYNPTPNEFDPSYWDLPRTGDRINGTDPAGHDNMLFKEDYDAFIHGEVEAERRKVESDPGYQAFEAAAYPDSKAFYIG